MKRLLDTHLLLWASYEPHKLPNDVREYLESEQSTPLFSIASLWEIAIKQSQGKPEFQYDTSVLYAYLLDSGYVELAIKASHLSGLGQLPWIHKDPFDRILLSQANTEKIPFWTSDAMLAQYKPYGFNVLTA